MKKLLFLLIASSALAMEKAASESAISVARKKSEQRNRDAICSLILELYVDPHNKDIRKYLAPALSKKLNEYYYSGQPEKKKIVEMLRNLSDDDSHRTPSPPHDIKHYIEGLVVEAVGDALKERDEALRVRDKELQLEAQKARLALLSNLGTAAITALGTALVFYLRD